MNEWISVEDSSPNMGEVVLIFGADEYPIPAYRTNHPVKPRWNDYASDEWVTGVTHWMPLPEPPE